MSFKIIFFFFHLLSKTALTTLFCATLVARLHLTCGFILIVFIVGLSLLEWGLHSWDSCVGFVHCGMARAQNSAWPVGGHGVHLLTK